MRIKICGITNVEDALAAADVGADAIGLNFYKRSPRYIDEHKAKEIVEALPPFVDSVGLFVNRSPQEIETWAMSHSIRTVQLHADEHEPPPSSSNRCIIAFSVREQSCLKKITLFLNRCRDAGQLPAAILVDAHVHGEYGGTGKTAPWELLADFDPGIPLILAGGLTPENVAEALHIVQPYAVDIASGVESSPGKKDRGKMQRFADAVHRAADLI